MNESEVETTQAPAAEQNYDAEARRDEDERKTQEDIRRMFFLGEGQTIKDVSWNQIIDKFRDMLNNSRGRMQAIILREVQLSEYMPAKEMSIEDETQAMVQRVDALIQTALKNKTSLGPLTEIKILLERYLQLTEVFAQQTEIWMRMMHVVVEKSKTEPATQEQPLEQMLREEMDSNRSEAKGLAQKLDTRIRHLEEDFAKHKRCKINYCHKGLQGGSKPKEEKEEQEEEPINKHLLKAKEKKKR